MQLTIWKARGAPRHPLYPGLRAARAATAKGEHAALAGSFDELARARAAGARARRAVFVLHYSGRPFLSEGERDALWEMFQAPVYGMLLARDGRVLGYECEAQDGLHAAANGALPAGMAEAGPCACGRPSLRLVAEAVATAQAAD
ncbi:MAG: hypothetical protein ABSH40_20375 [Bryobacteraceae bacterium]|jgi:hypothetical protein